MQIFNLYEVFYDANDSFLLYPFNSEIHNAFCGLSKSYKKSIIICLVAFILNYFSSGVEKL